MRIKLEMKFIIEVIGCSCGRDHNFKIFNFSFTKRKGLEAHNWPRRTGVFVRQERDVDAFERHVKIGIITPNVPVRVRHNMPLMS